MNINRFDILDCTIRDGGYYTNWNFKEEFIKSYLLACANTPVSIIELGYISDAKDSNGPYYHLDKNALKRAKKILGANKKLFVMINFKEVNSSNDLDKLLKNKAEFIDGVRFAVAPKNIKKFSSIITKIAPKYKTLSFNLNLMYLSEWMSKPKAIHSIFRNISKYIDKVSFVDSYGALTPEDINSFMKKINYSYEKKFFFGCHFHNNCGLALANALTAQKNGCKIVDTTFTGMGRGAGNAETELFMSIFPETRKKIQGFYLNNFLEKLEKLKFEMKWGSSFAYAFAAKNGFSQSEMMDLIQKRRLSPATAIEVISNKKSTKTILFKDKKTLDKLKFLIKSTPIAIGGAKSFLDNGNQLLKTTDKKSPIIFSGNNAFKNFLKLKIKIDNPKILVLTGDEIKKMDKKFQNLNSKKLNLSLVIAEEKFLPTNLLKKNNKIIYSDSVAENPLLLLGKLLIKLNCKKLNIAFFDGNVETAKDKIVYEETQKSIDVLNKKLSITTITKSFFRLKYTNPWLND